MSTIYVSGPLRAPTLEGRLANVQRAIDTGTALAQRGWFPFIPHLSHYWDPDDTLFGWEWWLRLDHHWVSACDALFYIAPSQGADLELGWARDEGKAIYTRVEDVPVVEAHHG